MLQLVRLISVFGRLLSNNPVSDTKGYWRKQTLVLIKKKIYVL